MKFLKHTGLLLVLLLSYATLNSSFMPGNVLPENNTVTCAEENSNYSTLDFITQLTAEQIQSYYTKRHQNIRDGFNGCVLVAKNGKPIYQGAFGYRNFWVKDTLTPQSSFQLASTSKTFTSAAILKLVEDKIISLDDSVQSFFPNFPYHGITVKLLLSHRTGLPDYIYWSKEFIGKGIEYLTNQTMLDLLMRKKPPIRTRPNRMFMYCNTNYALLACIIEKVSGMSYKKYMEQNIFKPLGMQNTFVFNIADSASHCGAICYESRWREWKLTFSDGVLGDKGIYSSVEDMLKWDNALKEEKVLSAEMLQEAYTPRSLDRYSFAGEKYKNYGYGWRMLKQKDGSYLIYHNGNWHGCNNVFARDLANGYTVIVLSNRANEKNYYTQTVWDILENMKNEQNVAAMQQTINIQ